jgi:uncharacterized protein YjbI with pentapeptide repeats
MATKKKTRTPPDLDLDQLTENLLEQLANGDASDATATNARLPALMSARGQSAQIDRCLLRAVSLSDAKAHRLHLHDTRIESSDLANLDATGGGIERVEIVATRLTGATFTEARLKSVLFEECKLDLALFRMARLEQCVFERCNLSDADLYAAALTGAIFRNCDLSRADLSQTKLAGADIRGCRLDGLRGRPAEMDGLIISPDQAALLMPLFGVRVEW